MGVVYPIVGDGDDRPRFEALAASTGVADRIRFLGPVPPEALPDRYRMTDLFVLPSTGEGFGIAFLEAMACGTPVLGLNVAGAKDALADGDLGTALRPSGNLALTTSVASVLQKTDRGDRLARRVLELFGRARFQARA